MQQLMGKRFTAMIWTPYAVLTALFALASADLRAAPIAVSPAGLAEQKAANQPEELRQALEAFKRGKFDRVLDRLQLAARNHSELPPAEVMLASMYFSDGQDGKGHKTLEDAAVKYPSDPEPHLIFGDLAFRARRFSDAQVQYEKGAELLKVFSGSPERKHQLSVRAITGTANVAEAQHRFEAAQKGFSALLKLEPQHPQGHFRLGNVLFAMGRPEEALAEFRAAADLTDSAPSPMLTLVELYKQAGKTDEAERWLSQAVEESPQDIRTQLAMAHWQLEVRNDPEAAEPFVEHAEQLDSASTDVAMLRGVIAWSHGELKRAEQLLASIALKEPQNLRANNCLAAVLAEQQDSSRRERAWELVQTTAAVNPRSLETAAAMGCVAYYIGNLQQAAQYLQTAVAGGAGRDAMYYLARTQYRQGQLARAQQTLKNALAADGLFIHLDDALQWQRKLNPGKKDQ